MGTRFPVRGSIRVRSVASTMPHRVAFYPCCANDVTEPLILLRGFADTVVFCDLKAPQMWQKDTAGLDDSTPKAEVLVEDVRSAVEKVERIDVLFYRRDSEGEGGSRVFILGDSFLPKILGRFPDVGGYLITDGSNSRGGNFKKMIRASGLRKHGWRFSKAPDQPFVEGYGLYVISVTREPATHDAAGGVR